MAKWGIHYYLEEKWLVAWPNAINHFKVEEKSLTARPIRLYISIRRCFVAMKRNKIFYFLVFLLLLSTLSFSIQRGGILQIAIPTDPSETLDPHRATGALTFEILYNIYEGLIQVDEKGFLVPSLSQSWAISEDAKSYVFFLKRGVRFHDGTAFTSADVLFSFQRILDPATGYSKASNYKVIEKIETPDEYTVRFTLRQSYAPFLALVSKIDIVPEGISMGDLDSAAIGTGPFLLREWKRDQYLHLIKNPNYHEPGIPYLEEAYFRVIPDENSRIIALKSKVIDVLPRADASSLFEFRTNADFAFLKSPMNLVQVLALNNLKEPFNNPLVRKALQHAINREACIELVAEGLAKPISTHLPPSDPFYKDFSEYYDYNPELSKSLLKQAGYEKGCAFTIQVPQPYTFHIRTGEVIMQMLNEAGFRVNLQIIEWGKWLSDVYNAREYQATIIGHPGEMDAYFLLERFYQGSNRNYMNVQIPQIDVLLDQSVKETDFQKRAVAIHGILELLVSNAVSYWIMEPEEIVLFSKEVQDWTIFPVYVDALKKVWKATK